MATEKPRFSITVSDEMLERIRDYQYTTRQKNRNEAVLRLIELGLDEFESVGEMGVAFYRASRFDFIEALEEIIEVAKDALEGPFGGQARDAEGQITLFDKKDNAT